MPEADTSSIHQTAPPRLPDSKDHVEGKPLAANMSARGATHPLMTQRAP